MQNEFEKQVQQQMEQFEIVPSEAVWQKVEGQIAQEKKKGRFFSYWFCAAVLIIIGIGSIFLINNFTPAGSIGKKDKLNTTNKEDVPGIIEQSKTEKENISKAENNKPETGIDIFRPIENNDTKSNKSIALGKQNSISPSKSMSGRKTSYSSVAYPNIKGVNTNSKENKSVLTTNENTSDIRAGSVYPNLSNNQTDSLSNVTTTDKSVIDSNKLAVNNPSTQLISNDTSSKKPEQAVKQLTDKASSKKFRFGVVVTAGVSNNVSGLTSLRSTRSLQESLQNLSSPSTTAAGRYTPVNNDFRSSLSVGIGAFSELLVSKRLSVNAGINYHSFATNLAVSNRIDSSRVYNDRLLNKRATVSSYYRPGSQSNFINRYNLIQLPVSFQWRINNNSLKPAQLYGGITPGFLIGSNSLYYNPYQGVYYKEKQQFNKFYMALETGLMFTIINTSTQQFKLGPTFQYNFTNLTKSEVFTQEHLMFYGLKTSITITK